MLQHYVFIKYQDGTTAEHIDLFCNRILSLKKLIPEVISLEIGRDILHDSRSWDLVLIMVFQSTETLRSYQKHREHQSVMKFNDPCVEQVASIDFVSSIKA
ncbi:MAG: stress protein [SAR86 cluster bacterium]|uniref:Stress protein n=1 Tax=SAR86 cluster bacterium TaxID=2030880 RepID=A0A2A5CEB6_9GAMM|nr:Dabb family protein [Gammaproteobacteria bacterium AH-315-E17]PCJ41716.1 MAG: stress protein [SAR86 cluster bacterium]